MSNIKVTVRLKVGAIEQEASVEVEVPEGVDLDTLVDEALVSAWASLSRQSESAELDDDEPKFGMAMPNRIER